VNTARRIRRLLALAGLVASLAVPAVAAAAGPWPSTYDSEIRAAWAIWHPGDDWRWWKAQLWQESRLVPTARSPVGAEGIAQFMPGTAAQYGLLDRRLAAPSIHAGARLMRDNLRFWRAPRTALSRRRLAQAGYNSGNGHLVSAQRLCGGPMEYPPIVACLPRVTGRHAAETTTYVERIERWYIAMGGRW
jgi:soluble lytic murein transglycosylase-like protein